MRSRIIVVFFCFFLIWSGLLVRSLYLQILPNENIKRMRARQSGTVVKLEPRRGDIVDRNGRELAASVASYSLFSDPKLVESPKRLAIKLAAVLKVSPRDLVKKLRDDRRRFVWIERRLTKEIRDQIDRWNEPGLGFVEEGRRIYPHETLLSQTIGLVGKEGAGLEGLEAKFETQLHGEEKRLVLQKDALGRPLLVNGQVFAERPSGQTLQLTVDTELQYFLEEELHQVTDDREAERAVGVVMDPKTGEILAMGSYPTFNSNTAPDANGNGRRNTAITDVFEPGSTLKAFPVAGALRAKKIQPNSKIYCEKGKFQVDGKWIRESDTKHKWEWLSVSEVLEHSSNIGATKIGFQLGQEELRHTLTDFGFGEKTGIELPGETRGILPALPWRQHHFSNISFGHGIAVSPIQVAAAYSVIANGGIWRAPTLVKGLLNPETKEVRSVEPRPERRVLSVADAATLRIMLTGVTSEFGTGTKARVPGFIVAGKTGTAQKVDPNGRGYLKGAFISSFAGLVPANDPQFVIYIAVDSAKKGHFGADVAAPVFNRVAEFALRRWGVSPTVITEKDVIQASAGPSLTRLAVEELKKQQVESIPDLRGMTVREVLDRVNGQNLNVELVGNGVVSSTSPAAGEGLPVDRRVRVVFSQ